MAKNYQLMTASELCEALGISRKTLYNWESSNKIEVYHLGHKIVVPYKVLESKRPRAGDQ